MFDETGKEQQSITTFWFVWYAFHDGTNVYQGPQIKTTAQFFIQLLRMSAIGTKQTLTGLVQNNLVSSKIQACIYVLRKTE